MPVRTDPVIVRDAHLSDVPSILEIYNESVVSSTATFDITPRTLEEYTAWFSAHDERHPVIVAEQQGVVVGWASLSRYSERAAYDATAEVSLYVRQSHRRRGIGSRLFSAIVDRGRAAGLHSLISRIAEGNDVSLTLHARLGFVTVGVLRQVGTKFGKLLDVVIMQLIYEKR